MVIISLLSFWNCFMYVPTRSLGSWAVCASLIFWTLCWRCTDGQGGWAGPDAAAETHKLIPSHVIYTHPHHYPICNVWAGQQREWEEGSPSLLDFRASERAAKGRGVHPPAHWFKGGGVVSKGAFASILRQSLCSPSMNEQLGMVPFGCGHGLHFGNYCSLFLKLK